MIRISIVTISYNQASYLPAAVDSILPQLGPEDTYIIVDPGSADGSRDIISDYASKDARIKPLLESDVGPADGLNNGFAKADGDICGYINADDFLLPGCLDRVREVFSTNGAPDVLIGAIKIADSEGRLRLRGRVPTLPSAERLLASANVYCQQGTFFRADLFRTVCGFNVENRTCWDFELIADFVIQGASFSVTSIPLAAFRIHPGSISGSGRLEVLYKEDRTRVMEKVAVALPSVKITRLKRWQLKIESRWSLLRLLLQFRPAPKSHGL